MKSILLQEFGVRAHKIKKLSGYNNRNYLVITSDSKYILKTYKFDEIQYDLVIAESEVLRHLSKQRHDYFPEPHKSIDGNYVKIIDTGDEKIIVRLLSFLEGDFFSEVSHSEELFISFGRLMATMDQELLGQKNYTIQSRQYAWDIQFVHLNKAFVIDIPEPGKRRIVEYFLLQFEEMVRPYMPGLRKSIIHNDGNDWNVLVNNGKVSGIIDFGDIVYSPIINEVAVGITYAIMGKDDPVLWASHIIRGYHSILPLKIEELGILYYLIAAQLCISVINSAHNKKIDPDNEYISISENRAWVLIYKWLETNPHLAAREFMQTCGYGKNRQEKVSEKIARRHQYIDPIVSISYKNPLFVTQAAFQYMYDGYGNTFLDAYNNIPHVGHAHPKVVKAGQKQMAKLNTNTRYVYDLLQAYSEKLLSKFPSSLNKVFFVNSGSAASDLAIRLARHHTRRDNIMVMEHGYHGHTMTGIEISDYKFSNEKGPGQRPWILKAPIPDTYRGKYKGENAGKKYAQEARQLLVVFSESVAAFISEPVVGCGGQVPLAPGYLKELYPMIRAQGGVCISDEVQTGFGRLGTHFWGFERHEVVPDIVVLGKPMGNGHPMGAVVTTQEIADSFNKGVEFFSSFGGNPVSCAIGLEVLNVIEDEQLQQNAMDVGNYYSLLMQELSNDFDCIGDVRGSGLFLGFEIVDQYGNHNRELASNIKNELKDRYILLGTDGPKNNVLKSKPPLCFDKSNVERVVENIFEILKKL